MNKKDDKRKRPAPASMKFKTDVVKVSEEKAKTAPRPKVNASNPKAKKGMPPLPIFDKKGK